MFEDKILICKECGKEFTFTAGEQEFYAGKGLQEPKYCKECRDARKAARRAERTYYTTVCARCGGDFDFTLTVDDFTASVETDEKSEFVDLTDELRQSIILALPSYPVCRQDCRGVCVTCGKNLNEGPCTCSHSERDSRWGALDALVPEKKDD